MSNPKKQKYFVDDWLDDPQFKDWLVKDKQNTRARYSVCHKVIKLLSSGKLALIDHGEGKNTEMLCQKYKTFLSKEVLRLVVKKLLRLLSVLAEKQSTIELHLEISGATKAEIIWALKSVMSCYSARSNEYMNETLVAMSPEFEATKSFQMNRSKSMYVVNHGLAPYFISVLKTNPHKADFLV